MARPRKHSDLDEQSPEEMMTMMLGVHGVHLIGIDHEVQVVRLVVETLAIEAVCPQCATPTELLDRPTRDVAHKPVFWRDLVFEWHVKRWGCPHHYEWRRCLNRSPGARQRGPANAVWPARSAVHRSPPPGAAPSLRGTRSGSQSRAALLRRERGAPPRCSTFLGAYSCAVRVERRRPRW